MSVTLLNGLLAPDTADYVKPAKVLALMELRKRVWYARTLAKELGVSNDAVRKALDALAQTGVVVSEPHSSGRQYMLPAQIKARPTNLVPPFKWDVWTKPLQGYDARMQAVMRMRSA